MFEPTAALVPQQEPLVTSPSASRGSAGAQVAIEIRGLSLTFQTADTPVVALSDIDLSIGRGEFVSFIGPSGCGKTTLLRVIADLVAPSGQISLTSSPT